MCWAEQSLWADEQAIQSVDLLFVDEAGQFSLANTLGTSAARSVVVLGDPQQLDQPQRPARSSGVGVSALTMSSVGTTMPSGIGAVSCRKPGAWHQRYCSFTSELFYAGKLKSLPYLAVQRLAETAVDSDRMPHDGNRSSSDEEVKAVAELVDQLIGAKWVDQDGKTCPLTATDLRSAPYNAQVNRLAARIIHSASRSGAVDKGTSAAVIYSMATSLSPEDAPRGDRILLLSQPPQRRHFARTLCHIHRCQPRPA